MPIPLIWGGVGLLAGAGLKLGGDGLNDLANASIKFGAIGLATYYVYKQIRLA